MLRLAQWTFYWCRIFLSSVIDLIGTHWIIVSETYYFAQRCWLGLLTCTEKKSRNLGNWDLWFSVQEFQTFRKKVGKVFSHQIQKQIKTDIKINLTYLNSILFPFISNLYLSHWIRCDRYFINLYIKNETCLTENRMKYISRIAHYLLTTESASSSHYRFCVLMLEKFMRLVALDKMKIKRHNSVLFL